MVRYLLFQITYTALYNMKKNFIMYLKPCKRLEYFVQYFDFTFERLSLKHCMYPNYSVVQHKSTYEAIPSISKFEFLSVV